jgi:hypothetical protein
MKQSNEAAKTISLVLPGWTQKSSIAPLTTTSPIAHTNRDAGAKLNRGQVTSTSPKALGRASQSPLTALHTAMTIAPPIMNHQIRRSFRVILLHFLAARGLTVLPVTL